MKELEKTLKRLEANKINIGDYFKMKQMMLDQEMLDEREKLLAVLPTQDYL